MNGTKLPSHLQQADGVDQEISLTVEGVEGSETVEGVEGVDGSETVEGVETVDGSETVDGVEGSDSVDGSEAVEGLQSAQTQHSFSTQAGRFGTKLALIRSVMSFGVAVSAVEASETVDGVDASETVDGVETVDSVEGVSAKARPKRAVAAINFIFILFCV